MSPIQTIIAEVPQEVEEMVKQFPEPTAATEKLPDAKHS